MKLTLKIFEGENEIQARELGLGAYRIGRSEFCDVVLEGKEVSRSHLEVRVTEASIYITNMSGAGRLKLNGERVETAEVKDLDQVQIGNYRVIFQIEAQSKETKDPIASELPENLESLAAPEASPGLPEEAPINFFGQETPAEEVKAESEMPAEPIAPEPMPMGEVREFPVPERSSYSPSYEGALALKEDTQVESKPIVAKLVFVEGPESGKEVPLEGYEVTLGRSRKADVFIDDDKLSRKHAKIARMGMGYRLIDLESRNGTYVNGVRVLEHPLSSFDVIEIGRTKIKFLILDLAMGAVERGGALQPVGPTMDTKSIQLVSNEEPLSPIPPSQSAPSNSVKPEERNRWQSFKESKRNRVLIGSLILMLFLYALVPDSPPAEKESEPKQAVAENVKKQNMENAVLPNIPKEFSELSPADQRKVEGHYNNAIRYQEREDYEQAYLEAKQLHTMIPYYKESKKLEALYFKKIKEKQKNEATEKASRDRFAELQIYIEDGVEYLKQGDFDRAAEAFNNAIVLDPQNATAAKGLKAAGLKIRDIEQLPPEVNPEVEKRKLVAQLMEQALLKFEEKSYQDAINLAEKIRTIEIKGETEYLNQAKQLIDRSKLQQKEEFEPFLIQAKEKFAEGDYNLSRDLCDEMLKRDPVYEAAQECSLRAKKQLNRLAKEAYTHGYILESMNRIEEAKQYWNRAKNYVRPGDPYYEKILKKLDNYQ